MNSASSSRPLDGKVALVTGASSGIGEATALALAEAGAKVAIAARRADRLAALAKSIEAAGGSALEIVADVTRAGDIERMVDAVVKKFGRLDILINNAGVMLLSPVAEASSDDWRRMVELNLIALMETTKIALPHLKASRGPCRQRLLGRRVASPIPAPRAMPPRSSAWSAFRNRCGAKSMSTRCASP